MGARGARDRRHPRGGRRAARAHLQPRPRRPAGAPIPPSSAGSSSSCTSGRPPSRLERRRRPDGVRLARPRRGHPPVPRGHPRGPAGLRRGRRGADRALPADRRPLAARRDHRAPAGRARAGARAARLRRDEALAAADRGSRRPGGRPAAQRRSSASCSRRTTPKLSIAGYRERLEGGARRPRRAALRRELARPRAVHRRARRPGARHRRPRRLHGALPAGADPGRWAIPTRTSCSRPRSSSPSAPGSTTGRSPSRARAPTGEPWLGPDILDELDDLTRAASRKVLVCPGRLRLRPPRDPLGHRRRGARAGRRARARARPDRVPERRSPRSSRPWPTCVVTVDVPSTSMNPASIVAENVSRRFQVYPQRNVTLKEAIVRRRAPEAGRSGRRPGRLVPRSSRALRSGSSGRNGSGKTTLLRLIAGIFRPSSGRLAVDGLGRLAARARRRASIPTSRAARTSTSAARSTGSASATSTRGSTRSSSSASSRSSSTSRSGPTRPGCTCGSASRSRRTSRRTSSLLDEVFAVGDEAFQRKCIDRVLEFREQGGRSRFVSHSGAALERMCDRAILLEQGRSSTTARRARRFAATRSCSRPTRPRRAGRGLREWGTGQARVPMRASRATPSAPRPLRRSGFALRPSRRRSTRRSC